MFVNMKYVYEVYREGSFSKAAQKLYISQPALSATVKKIEKKIGMPLFDRSKNPIRLTDCGKKYIKMAEKIMEMEDEFSSYVENLNDLSAGKLSIGGTYLFLAFVIPEIVQRFRTEYPNVKISLTEGHTSQLENLLFDGEIDLVLDNYPMDPEIYDRRFFKEENLLLAVPKTYGSNIAADVWGLTANDIKQGKHRRPEAHGAPLKIFENDPFVLLRAHNDTRERVENICKRAGIAPSISWKLDQMLTTYHMTERGMGISFISDTAIEYMPVNQNIIFYKIDDPEAKRNVYFYYRKNKYFTRSMAEFIKIAASETKN